MSEVFFNDGNIEISETIARFDNTSYPIKNIGAVTVETNKTGFKGAAIIAILGGLAAFAFLPSWVGGILLFVGIALLFAKPVTESKLMLRTSSGNTQAFASQDQKKFQEIQRALEKAIALK